MIDYDELGVTVGYYTLSYYFLLGLRRPPRFTLLPYSTLFRSDPLTTIEIRPRVSGEILKIHFKEGDEVKQNELRSEEHTSELQSHSDLVCRLLLETITKSMINPTFARLISNCVTLPKTQMRLT